MMYCTNVSLCGHTTQTTWTVQEFPMSRKNTRTFKVRVYTIKGGRMTFTNTLEIRRLSNSRISGGKRALQAAHALFNLPQQRPQKQKLC